MRPKFSYPRYKSLERFDAKASKPFTLIAIMRLAKCFTNSLVKYYRFDSLVSLNLAVWMHCIILYPHLCIKYVQSLFYHIFLKKYGLFYKKGTILLWKEEWFAFDYFKVGDWTRHGLLGGCTEQCLRCSSCRDARLLRLALPSPRFGLRHRQVLLLWVTQGHSHTCLRWL